MMILLVGVKSAIKAFLKSALDNDGGTSIEQSIESIPPRLLENFLINEQAIAQWGTGASSWVKNLGKIFMEAIVETEVSMPKNQKLGVATNSYMRSLIEVMNSENAVELEDFYPGIEPVSASRDEINPTMKFNGEYVDHFKFDPVKSRVFRTASEGLAYGAYDSLKIESSSDINKTNLDSFASNSLSSLLDYLNEELNGDHSLFSYEVARAVSLD